ncbi:MAG: cytochrome P450 [Deltaproteobacteria bacterium]|nr:cytochrome P450 [Deltaproteobacteria bacterium]
MKPPGPGSIQFVLGARRQGFLSYVGSLWHQHGDLFQAKIGPRTLVFAMHPDAVERVAVSHRSNYDKLRSYDPVREFLLGDGLVSSTGDLWRRQRKWMAPFYTPKGVQTYAEAMLRDGERLVERWGDLAKRAAEVDIAEEMTFVTASIILKAMFSTETLDAIHQIKDAVETMIGFASNRMTSLPLPLWVPTGKNQKYLAARTLVHRLINEIIAQRRAMPESDWPDDLLSRMMNARDEETGQPMAESLLRDESITTFFAGHETTARTMTFAWYALAANPAVADELRAELDHVLGGRAPTVSDLRALPYTLQVVKESLRLYPAAPFYIRDAVGPDTLGGFEIPAGAGVMLSPYFTHRHPGFWEHPERFDPARWRKENESKQHAYAYHPFAAGPRICIGNNFSLLESHLLLAMLAQRFVPKLRTGYVPQWEMQGTLHLGNGLPMTITARD